MNYFQNEKGANEAVERADVRKKEDVIRLAEQAVAAFGPIDILVNNAGKGNLP